MLEGKSDDEAMDWASECSAIELEIANKDFSFSYFFHNFLVAVVCSCDSLGF